MSLTDQLAEERRAKREQLAAIVNAVAQALGPEWKPVIRDDWSDAADIRQDAGPRLYLSTARERGRLYIGAGFNGAETHRPWRHDIPGGHLSHSITVSLGKSGEAIARDIKRRLFPDYLPEYAETMQRKAQAEAQRDEAFRAAQEIARIFGAAAPERRRDEGSYTVYGDGVDAEVSSGGSVRFKIGATDPAQALTIARALVALSAGSEAQS